MSSPGGACLIIRIWISADDVTAFSDLLALYIILYKIINGIHCKMGPVVL